MHAWYFTVITSLVKVGFMNLSETLYWFYIPIPIMHVFSYLHSFPFQFHMYQYKYEIKSTFYLYKCIQIML